MSTVAEIKATIDQISPGERAEVARCLSEWQDIGGDSENKTPPNVREKLAQAAQGRFQPGDRSNISKILSSLK